MTAFTFELETIAATYRVTIVKIVSSGLNTEILQVSLEAEAYRYTPLAKAKSYFVILNIEDWTNFHNELSVSFD